MQAAAGGRRWRWCAVIGCGGCAAAVRSGKAGRLWALCRWAGLALVRGHLVRRAAAGVVIGCSAGGADPSRCRWWAVRSAAAAVRWRGHRDNGGTTPSACRAADPADRAGGRAWKMGKRKRPGRRRVVRCCSGLWSALADAICCAGCIPVHIVGGGGLLLVPVPGCWRWH